VVPQLHHQQLLAGVEADIAEQLTGEGLVQPRDTEDRMTHRADTGDGPFR
jgi:hypothetical protein